MPPVSDVPATTTTGADGAAKGGAEEKRGIISYVVSCVVAVVTFAAGAFIMVAAVLWATTPVAFACLIILSTIVWQLSFIYYSCYAHVKSLGEANEIAEQINPANAASIAKMRSSKIKMWVALAVSCVAILLTAALGGVLILITRGCVNGSAAFICGLIGAIICGALPSCCHGIYSWVLSMIMGDCRGLAFDGEGTGSV
jgi:hypothetical protein